MDINEPRAMLVAVLALSGLLSAARAETSRVEIGLNGAWQFQKVKDLAFPPRGEWKETKVPGTVNGWNYERAWFRTSFAAPAAFASKRVKVRFGGVKYNSVVYVNGQKVGGCFGGYEPFEVDITAAVKVGGQNELLVGVHDWTGLFSKQVDLSQVTEWHQVRGTPKDALLSVIGGLFS
ncbi:MAG: hypothetical protein FJ279_38025, partial [Planctomycetes bacterium]|nr:hypothetical protein [Planctomycetota bacterium]